MMNAVGGAPQAPAGLIIGVPVPNDRIAPVIGKAGAGLKFAREQSRGCQLAVVQDDQNNPGVRPRVNLSGDPSAIAVAFGIVADKAFTEEAHGPPCVLVPADKAGGIIGKGGERLKQIRSMTGVQVIVDREPVTDPSTGAQERRVSFNGPKQNLANALAIGLTGSAAPGMPQMSGGGQIGQATDALAAALQAGGLSANPAVLNLVQQLQNTIQQATKQGSPAGGGAPQQMQSGAALSSVKPSDADPDSMQVQIFLDAKVVGAVVGKEGATIKQTAANYGVNAWVTRREEGPRRVALLGPAQNVLNAENAVYQQIAEASGQEDIGEMRLAMLIRQEAAGAVMGKGGQQMIAIKQSSQAQIKIERDSIEGQRPCFISGGFADIVQAQRLIHDIVRQVPISQEPQQSSMGKRPAAAMGGMGGMGGPVIGNMSPSTAGVAPTVGVAPQKRQRMEQQQTMSPMQAMQQIQQQIQHGQSMPMQPGQPMRQNGATAALGPDATRVLIPKQLTGAVIGKQGSMLKQVREHYGIDMRVLADADAPQWDQDRVLSASGPLDNKVEAIKYMLQVAYGQDSDSLALKLLVPAQAAGGVVGKQGSTLNGIRQQAGIDVQLERNDVAGDRLLFCQGPADNIAYVLHQVAGILERSGAGGSGMMQQQRHQQQPVQHHMQQAPAVGMQPASNGGIDFTKYFAAGAASAGMQYS
eukprot:TRINITY_DN451_c1_g1_i1.p1 TRINITY_DN451_c1_g1~~TRINITY_DN451_c1_g1_i1.p1  ORF type:complete len:697 (+),score=148.35 TRINITY_DN451_c1_g1_i1:119-2209(+)